MSSTKLENPPRTSESEPRRLNLSQDYIDDVIASMDRDVAGDKRQAAGDTLSNPEMVVTSTIGAPDGFPSTREVETSYEELGPVHFTLRHGISYAVGFPLIKAHSYLSNRALKKKTRFDSMSAKEQIAYVEKTGRIASFAALGSAALYAVLRTHALDHLVDAIDSESVKHTVEDHGDKIALARNSYDYHSHGPAGHEPGNANVVDYYTQHPDKNPNTVSNFVWDYNQDPARQSSGKHGNDFGTALVESPEDIKFKQPAGMRDLLNRWMDSPKEFATVMSKFGIIPNNPAAINQAAEIMADPQKGPKLYQDAYREVIEQLSKSKVEIKDITAPYGSYYIVDKNGVLTVAYDNYVDHGGTMFVITTPDGKTICLRRECGGQPIDMLPQQVPASPEVQRHAVAQNQPAYVQKQTPAATHETPSDTPVEDTPTEDTHDTPPEDTTDTPPPTTEEEHKTDQYQKDPNVVQRGPNNFEKTPKPVDKTVVTPAMPGIDQPPIVDNHKKAPSSETGGAAPGKTAPSMGKPGASESAGGGSSADHPKTGTASGPQ